MNNVGDVYRSVIRDVMEKVKENMGDEIDSQVLNLLQQKWESKLMQSGALSTGTPLESQRQNSLGSSHLSIGTPHLSLSTPGLALFTPSISTPFLPSTPHDFLNTSHRSHEEVSNFQSDSNQNNEIERNSNQTSNTNSPLRNNASLYQNLPPSVQKMRNALNQFMNFNHSMKPNVSGSISFNPLEHQGRPSPFMAAPTWQTNDFGGGLSLNFSNSSEPLRAEGNFNEYDSSTSLERASKKSKTSCIFLL
eukprot:TRINITY_DN4559_c0_g1_i1.p1 TRINITY_DN4559_c0_g1~~TRINITY_DN4559_c0_g1_i1.p1  ORF type:complete len:249 (-),score=80.54 TRINITY_DN4559_c0_g1_i1:473-1219(-)